MLLKTLEKATAHPRVLFIIDGLGAVTSAFLLGVLLVKLERVFGIPSSTLYFLAVWPILFAVYDFFCYHRVYDQLEKYLKGIALMNLMYCCLSIGAVFYHSEVITRWGWAYILAEIIIVLVLSIIELKVANRWIKKDEVIRI